MVKIFRHCQPKGAETDRLDLNYSRHCSTRLFGRSFWARGYFVSTVGIDEAEIRQYIKEQEKLQKEQIELDFD